jgi:hypothetical protein
MNSVDPVLLMATAYADPYNPAERAIGGGLEQIGAGPEL